MKNNLLTYMALFSIFCVFSCGYKLQGGSSLPGNITKINVRMFDNKSSQIGAESIFTNSLVNEFIKSTNAKVVDEKIASAFVNGAIRSVTLGGLTQTSDDSVKERRVTASIDLEIKKLSGDVVFAVVGFTQSHVYSVSR